MSLIPFIAIAHKDENGFLRFTHYNHSSSQTDEEERINELSRYQSLAIHKLKDVNVNNFNSIFPSQMGKWYVKSIDRQIFTVVTSDLYPVNVAVEIVDELYETFEAARKIWGSKKRKAALDACCLGIAHKYSTLEEDSAAHVLMTQVDEDVSNQYSQNIKILMDEVEKVKEQLNDNIQGQLQNIETAERLQEKTDDLLDQAKAFKKKAKDLSWKMWFKKKRGLLAGTAAAGTAGGVAGFMLGGPAGAGIFTGMASVAGAQALETLMLAGVSMAGFVGARSAVKNWFWTQKFVIL